MSYDLFSDSAKDTALDAIGATIMGSQEVELLKQVFVAAGQGNSFASITGDPEDNAALAEALQGMPIVVSARNITVLTSGAPSDIASITLPAWLTRYMPGVGTSATTCWSRIIAETAAGTLAAGQFGVYSGAGGTGTLMTTGAVTTLPVSAGATSPVQFTAGAVFANNTIYIRQTANSANAGTISVYLVLVPFL